MMTCSLISRDLPLLSWLLMAKNFLRKTTRISSRHTELLCPPPYLNKVLMKFKSASMPSLSQIVKECKNTSIRLIKMNTFTLCPNLSLPTGGSHALTNPIWKHHMIWSSWHQRAGLLSPLQLAACWLIPLRLSRISEFPNKWLTLLKTKNTAFSNSRSQSKLAHTCIVSLRAHMFATLP